MTNLTASELPGPPEELWINKLGPGLITGAADDDPSGIATYSQAGAQFGFSMLWTTLFTYPLMVGIQIVSAQIGRVSGHGLATNIRRHYPPWLLYCIVGLLLLANTINIAADIAAMSEALKLLVGGATRFYALGFGMASVLLQVFIPYNRYVRILKWLTLALLAYVGVVFAVRVPWDRVIIETFLPHLSWKTEFITTVVAVFGTTISPYLFLWQTSQEVEEELADPKARPLKYAPQQAHANFRRIKLDTHIGMGFSNLIAYFIILTTAVTLHQHGVTDIQTSAQAASALRPIAGEFAFWLFSAGIIGTGLLAIPVLAGSAAYAMAGAFDWKNSLESKPSTARKFYSIIVLSTLLGVALCFTPIDPIKALYWSAVINGVISVPIMIIMMLMAGRPDIMGRFVIRRRLRRLGWACTSVMALAVVIMLVALAGSA
ncbi:NRAMP family divalent metal transporter [Eoetvoesiella caeni]|uniref:NRAMP (Natural resistance-associated macrophage protein)-like metal ion transporter n=1 Tax=Eoetvoesiella caeni TaxID=645616 RepID=A0A366HLR8_9BURK|nr:divalent metal cation transporter [Eoetvoesiella caeni]MCI2807687.1 divalent metal cation transporter [Eoetvoesiella caeni]NYT52918.1 divalent metal cation transporter [Eoetvoesiella caeni]RBP42895.1 NRAMP (natural resistance-associated macrophage protein)-like metal ion transporter [Eoetvoesiella caeni]